MKAIFINKSLNKDLKSMINNRLNIVSVNASSVSGESIEVETKEPFSIDSYVYYSNYNDRNSDLELLNKELLK
jgi:hypothetical protein